MDFSLPGSRDFLNLAPQLGQIFYIGNGLNSLSQYQQFVAPTGATRLFFGIPDGFGFGGAPGAYDDNDGSYRISVGVNQIPSTSVPDGGSTAALLLIASLGLIVARRRRS